MSEILNLFKTLSDLYNPNIFWEDVEELYEKEYNVRSQFKDEDDFNTNKENENRKKESLVTDLDIVKKALTDTGFVDILQEICSILRCLRNDVTTGYMSELDNWENLMKVVNRDAFLSIVYTFSGLSTLDPTNVQYVKLSITVINAYFLSLTIPGAKAFEIFDEDIIAHCLKIFTVPERLQHPDVARKIKCKSPSEIWIPFKILLDDIKILLRYVHFTEYSSTRTLFIQRVMDIQFLNYDKGFANHYLIDLHNYCFDIFDLMINSSFGEPEETIYEILNASALLHTYATKPKVQAASLQTNNCLHISDWFVQKISNQPTLLQKVLEIYIQSIITNPESSWKSEQIQRAMEYAVKYDAALFKISNVSSVEFLNDAVYADELQIRLRAIDMISHLLLTESSVDWQMFRHEVSEIPREVNVIGLLIDLLEDSNNSVRAKASQALYNGLMKGSPNTRLILKELVLFTKYRDSIHVMHCEPPLQKNEVRYSKPNPLSPSVSFKGFAIVAKRFAKLPKVIYKNLFRSHLAYCRRLGIMFMEELIKLNPLIIFETAFVNEFDRLASEPCPAVRKQMMLSIDNILENYPNCYPVVWAWCKSFSPMMSDPDPKNIDVASACFNSRVLLNIRSFDQSTKAEHFMPWAIIRTLLLTQNRYYLQNQFVASLKIEHVNESLMKTVESHLLTTNATEAWVLLNFLTSKFKRRDPDALLRTFLSIDSGDKEEINVFLGLEVLTNCVENFSHASLNLAFKHIHKSFWEGSLSAALITTAFSLLQKIDQQNKKSKRELDDTDGDWKKELIHHLEESLLKGIMLFPDDGQRFISYMNSYTEINIQSSTPPNKNIVDFVFYILNGFLKKFDEQSGWENVRNLNAMITTAARFSLRNAEIANKAMTILISLLKKADRESIVQTIIMSLKDICRKHTQLFENNMHFVLQKLESGSLSNQLVTFQCFESLVLEDQLKLRGNLLLALLSCTLSINVKLLQNARSFFVEYLQKKDAKLFSKCLMECPYVLNNFKGFGEKSTNFDSSVESPLSGEEFRIKREMLYEYLMSHVDEIFLTSYFDRLKIISQKCKTDPNMTSPEGIGLVKDVFFILSRICENQNNANSNAPNEEIDEELLLDIKEEIDPTPNPNASNTNNANAATNGPGKGRRRPEVPTLDDALVLVEKSLICIPTIYQILKPHDSSMEESVERLCCAIIIRFPQYTQYAQPAEFWEIYKSKSLLEANSSKYSIHFNADDSDDSDSPSDSSDNEDELPMTPIKKTPAVPTKASPVAQDEQRKPPIIVPEKTSPAPLSSSSANRNRKRKLSYSSDSD